jgi:mono/diheme cytochrome c family protein
MRRLKLGLLFSAAALLAACATATNTNTSIGNSNRTVTVNAGNAPAAPATPVTAGADDLAWARNTYKGTCAKCHQENGEGGPVELDEGARLRVPSFKTAHSIAHTDQQLARKIANGDKDEGMPAFKDRLSPEQINALVRFIRAEFQSAGAKEGPGH